MLKKVLNRCWKTVYINVNDDLKSVLIDLFNQCLEQCETEVNIYIPEPKP